MKNKLLPIFILFLVCGVSYAGIQKSVEQNGIRIIAVNPIVYLNSEGHGDFYYYVENVNYSGPESFKQEKPSVSITPVVSSSSIIATPYESSACSMVLKQKEVEECTKHEVCKENVCWIETECENKPKQYYEEECSWKTFSTSSQSKNFAKGEKQKFRTHVFSQEKASFDVVVRDAHGEILAVLDPLLLPASCEYSGTGDWLVNQTCEINYSDGTPLVINGDLIIGSNGTLKRGDSLSDGIITFTFNNSYDGEYGLNVTGGNFTLFGMNLTTQEYWLADSFGQESIDTDKWEAIGSLGTVAGGTLVLNSSGRGAGSTTEYNTNGYGRKLCYKIKVDTTQGATYGYFGLQNGCGASPSEIALWRVEQTGGTTRAMTYNQTNYYVANQGDNDFKMVADTYYTLCLEMVNTTLVKYWKDGVNVANMTDVTLVPHHCQDDNWRIYLAAGGAVNRTYSFDWVNLGGEGENPNTWVEVGASTNNFHLNDSYVSNCGYSSTPCIDTDTAGTIIDNVSFTNLGLYGILFRDSADDSILKNSRFTGGSPGIVYISSNAEGSGHLIDNNDIANCSGACYGIELSGVDQVRINNNRFFNIGSTSASRGVYACTSTYDVVLNNNSFSQLYSHAVNPNCDAVDDWVVSNNSFDSPASASTIALLINSADDFILDNNTVQDYAYGVRISGNSYGGLMSSNHVSNASTVCYDVDSSEDGQRFIGDFCQSDNLGFDADSSQNTTIYNASISSVSAQARSTSGAIVNIINLTSPSVSVSGAGNISVYQYARVKVEYEGVGVSGAFVNLTDNASATYFTNEATDASGFTSWATVLYGFFQDGTTTLYEHNASANYESRTGSEIYVFDSSKTVILEILSGYQEDVQDKIDWIYNCLKNESCFENIYSRIESVNSTVLNVNSSLFDRVNEVNSSLSAMISSVNNTDSGVCNCLSAIQSINDTVVSTNNTDSGACSSCGSSNLTASDVWGYGTRELTDYCDAWSCGSRTLTSGLISASDVWTYGTRNLTYYPSYGNGTSNLTASDVWNYPARLLSDYAGVWAYAERTLTNYNEKNISKAVYKYEDFYRERYASEHEIPSFSESPYIYISLLLHIITIVLIILVARRNQ